METNFTNEDLPYSPDTLSALASNAGAKIGFLPSSANIGGSSLAAPIPFPRWPRMPARRLDFCLAVPISVSS